MMKFCNHAGSTGAPDVDMAVYSGQSATQDAASMDDYDDFQRQKKRTCHKIKKDLR